MRTALCVLFLLLAPRTAPSDEPRKGPRQAPSLADQHMMDSLAAEFRRRAAELTSPALEQRKADRRRMQKRGYAEVLAEVLRDDGPGALFAFARMKLHLEFSLPNDNLVVYYPIVPPDARRDSLPGFTTFGSKLYPFPLVEDRRIPADPWEDP
jgi:hypothetical protein